MKIIFFALTIMLMGCGKENKTSYQNATSNPSRVAPIIDEEALYNSLTGSESPVEISGRYGASIVQRTQDTTLCRKSGAVVPNPVYRYECWQTSSTEAQAESTFNSIPNQEYGVFLTKFIGGGTVEKINSDRSLLCQEHRVSSPGAESSYECYKAL